MILSWIENVSQNKEPNNDSVREVVQEKAQETHQMDGSMFLVRNYDNRTLTVLTLR